MLTDLYTYLVTAPGVGADPTRAAALTALQAIVVTSTSPFAAKVYPDFLSERQTNALVYQLIDNSHLGYILDGDPIDIDQPRVQIDVYSDDPVTRELMGGYVKAALDGFSGSMASTDVAILMFDNEQNSFEADSKQYRKTLDFKVVHYS